MRWKKANRNKQRALAHARRKPVIAEVGWRQWLDKIMPDVLSVYQNQIFEDSLFARLVKLRTSSAHETMTLPMLRYIGGSPAVGLDYHPRTGPGTGRPLFTHRLYRLAKSLWESQDRCCADCLEETPFEEMTKHSASFKIICQKCYERHKPVVMIVDDLDFPMCAPRRLKQFIYGESWNAYKRLEP